MKKTLPLSIFSLLSIIFMVINGCKKDPVVPTLTTSPVSNITVSTLTTGGIISKDGDAEITARGVCYSTSATPVVSGLHSNDDKGTGSFTSTISGLTPNTVYHIRAYATNKVGTAYGEELTASTIPIVLPTLSTIAVSAITITTAITGGNITSDGNATVTVRGVCWATTANPTIANTKTTDGAGAGAFTSNLSGLIASTTYHVRAYATNSVGTSYGSDLTFTSNSVTLATISTNAVTDITQTTAVSGGTITTDGGGTITARGVCWAATANPTISGSKTTNGTGTGTFTSSLLTLTPGSTYHIRAYTTNAAGTAYGNDVVFTSNPVVVPTLTTTGATSVTQTTAVSGGNIGDNGGSAIIVRGVCWSTTPNPVLSSSKTTDGSGNGAFASSITGLLPGTTYHIRAYATNSAGIAYGNDISFVTTAIVPPTINTLSVSSIDLTSGISGGNITNNGGGVVSVSGICWSTSSNPTTGNSKTTDGTSLGNFTSTITGLSKGTTYYVKAYATNSAGTTYGNQVSFNTQIDDREGNRYNTVTIGSQIWMKENLRATKFNDGSIIKNITDDTEWSLTGVGEIPAYCWFSNDISHKNVDGALYNWYVVKYNICPTGWKVPSEEDFRELETHLGVPTAQLGLYDWRGTDQGSMMKTTSGWTIGTNGTNSSGFTGTPGGYRYGMTGAFYAFGVITYWWTATETAPGENTAWYRRLDGDNTGIFRSATHKWGGKFVRCIKN